MVDQEAYFEVDTKENIYMYVQLLDKNFRNVSFLKDEAKTSEAIYWFMYNNQKVENFNILSPDYDGELKILASSSESSNPVSEYDEYNTDIFSNSVSGTDSYSSYIPHPDESIDPNDIFYMRLGQSYDYLVVCSIPSDDGTGYIGTYELIVSFEKEFNMQNIRLNNIRDISLFFLVTSVILIFFINRSIFQKPIYTLKDAVDSFGKGKFDTRVDIESSDELGELSSTFNQMADDLKDSRGKIEEYNRILEKIIDQKDEFIGQLGHDLKNPLQPLVGLLPMIIEKESDPDTKEALQVMHQNVEYMQNLIFSTLELAKLRSDNVEFNFEMLNLGEMTEDMLNSQKLILKGKNIEIENNISKEIFVEADKLRLSEVFKNLINNAVKYNREPGGKITFDAKQIEENMVEISVKDEGIGMSSNQISQIFDDYYKADEQTSDFYSTGLGLPICKRIVKKHGGEIWADSPGLGKGSTFHFTLKKIS